MNNLIEITLLKTLSPKMKKSSYAKNIITNVYNTIRPFELFTCGIQQKNNKIRILCNSETWTDIKKKIYTTLNKNDLDMIGYTYIN